MCIVRMGIDYGQVIAVLEAFIVPWMPHSTCGFDYRYFSLTTDYELKEGLLVVQQVKP